MRGLDTQGRSVGTLDVSVVIVNWNVFEATLSGVMGDVMRRAADFHYKRQAFKTSPVVHNAQYPSKLQGYTD